MRILATLILATAAATVLSACGDSGSTTTAPSGASATQRAAEDLHAAEETIKSAATQAATEVRPAYEHAKEETRQAVHDAAEKIAESTATAPAPPATQP